MSTVQYRIKKVGDRCYPQVRFKQWIGWSSWKRIGKHMDGYGLYSYDGYPQDAYDCESTIRQYHKSCNHTAYTKVFSRG